MDKFRGTAHRRRGVRRQSATPAGTSATTASRSPSPTAARARSRCSAGPTARRRSPARSATRCDAGWRLSRGTAVIEMAAASGLALVGGGDGQRRDGRGDHRHGRADRPGARRRGAADHRLPRRVGHDRRRARRGAGDPRPAPAARRAAARRLRRDHPLRRRGAEVFGPQKGASPAQVRLLAGRLERTAQIYASEYGVDVRDDRRVRAPPAGWPAALLALGGKLVPGFDLVADELDLYDTIAGADARRHRRGLPRRAELRGQGGRRRAGAGGD